MPMRHFITGGRKMLSREGSVCYLVVPTDKTAHTQRRGPKERSPWSRRGEHLEKGASS